MGPMMQVMINNHLPFEVWVDADKLRDLAWTQLRAVESHVVAIRVDLETLEAAKPHAMFSAHVEVRLKAGRIPTSFLGYGQSTRTALTKALVEVRTFIQKSTGRGVHRTTDDDDDGDL